MIRKANKKDISMILAIYDYARCYMIKANNPDQWPSYYPSEADIKKDISNDALYVYESDGKLIGVFAFYIGEDENYQKIYNGIWHYHLTYGTIHRIASLPNNIHFADRAIDYCRSLVPYLRIDTHKANSKMLHVIMKNGFKYCGEIYVRKDQLRMAFDYSSYKKIYVAGGCFWGVEHYYSLLKGIISTRVGYANGELVHPTYEQVKHHETSHAETVELIYDPTIISLTKILEHFLRFVDPYEVDHQGGDYGHQYRSGIYFIDENDKHIIEEYFNSHILGQYKIEILPLENFYDAEDYHQAYLYKNPSGYCHINMNLIKDNERKK